MLRRIRIVLAVIFFVSITLLFLDFKGEAQLWLGWMAKIQFLPALLAFNFLIILGLIILTLIIGRIYCSVICPLGIMQDIIAWFGKKKKKNRYSYSKPLNVLRYTMLIILIIAWTAGISSLISLFAPYSSYGRIAGNLLQPIWIWINNGLALLAERADSYMFYSVDVWIKSIAVFIISILTFVIIAILAWRNGRTYCNSVCPVGTVLGFLSKYSWFKPVIDSSKCINCGLCARRCKASCINPKYHSIDYSRCVDCFDCIESCKKNAISFTHITYDTSKIEPENSNDKKVIENLNSKTINTDTEKISKNNTVTQKDNTTVINDKTTIISDETIKNDCDKSKPTYSETDTKADLNINEIDKSNFQRKNIDHSSSSLKDNEIDESRRKFLTITALFAVSATLKGKGKLVDGGLAVIKDKQIPQRHTPITPAGSFSARNMAHHCTGCQLCVSACPNDVLRPSTDILHIMQPVMSYERGYCRPECTRCSDVCPTGAIHPITKAEKSSIQIGHAVWIRKNCVALTDNVECGNCARHCPTGAIQMVPSDTKNIDAPMIPVINTERCIGCGTCENLCPARPFSAIYVEGHENHRII